MAVKVTFTLDEATVARLSEVAARLRQPKSAVVREAIRDFHAAADRLSEEERDIRLRALSHYQSQPRRRSGPQVRAELAELRSGRRESGRRTP